MYSFMDKCTLCYFNKNVANEVMWYREDNILTSLICISLGSSPSSLTVFLPRCTQKTYSMGLV